MGQQIFPIDDPVVDVDWEVPCGNKSPSGRECAMPRGHGGCCAVWGQTEHKYDESWWAACWKVGCRNLVVPGWRGCASHKR